MPKPNYKVYTIQAILIVILGMVLALNNTYNKKDMIEHQLNQCKVESEILEVKLDSLYDAEEKERPLNEKELTCLAMNIYFESGNKSYEEKLAIATVTLNRVLSGKYPKTICGVVWEKKPRAKKCQFAWTCDGKSDHITDPKKYFQSLEVAKEVLIDNKKSDIIDESVMHFYSGNVKPHWISAMKFAAYIGDHKFYVEGG